MLELNTNPFYEANNQPQHHTTPQKRSFGSGLMLVGLGVIIGMIGFYYKDQIIGYFSNLFLPKKADAMPENNIEKTTQFAQTLKTIAEKPASLAAPIDDEPKTVLFVSNQPANVFFMRVVENFYAQLDWTVMHVTAKDFEDFDVEYDIFVGIIDDANNIDNIDADSFIAQEFKIACDADIPRMLFVNNELELPARFADPNICYYEKMNSDYLENELAEFTEREFGLVIEKSAEPTESEIPVEPTEIVAPTPTPKKPSKKLPDHV